MNLASNHYPIIDLNTLSEPETLAFFKEFGFILVKDSLFGKAKIQSYFDTMKGFFAQLRQDQVATYAVDDSNHGIYIPVGLEHLSSEIMDSKEVFDFFHQHSYTGQYYKNHLNFQLERLQHPFITKDLQAIKQHSLQLFSRLLTVFSKALNGFDFGLQQQSNYLFRLIHYPPIFEPNPRLTRLGTHVDDDLLALVIAQNTNGLKINTPAYGWMAVPNIENVFVVLIGGCLEFITEGAFKGTEHKVDVDEKATQSRYVFNINLGSDLDFSRPAVNGKLLQVQNYYQSRLSKYTLLEKPL